MGRKGSRYSVEEKLYYIGLVDQGMRPRAVRKWFGVHNSQLAQWIERYQAAGIEGLKPRSYQSYTSEFKLRIVTEYLDGHTSYPKLCRQYDISNPGVIAQWVARYNGGKLLNTTRRQLIVKNGRNTTQLERIEITQWVIANKMNYIGAVTKFDVSYGQVYSWVKKFKQGGDEALVDHRGHDKEDHGQLTESEKQQLEIKRLKARLEMVSTENAILKKLQELERGPKLPKNNIKPFKHLQK